MIDDDLAVLNAALDTLDPELAFVWRETHGHRHDGQGPIGAGKTFRQQCQERAISLSTIRERYRVADRAICSYFARHYRRMLSIRGEADAILAPPRKYTERRKVTTA